MRVSKIEIKKLFGMFNHVIPFNMRDRITIIHGPNGFGKTTILRLMTDLFSRRFYLLRRTPFGSIVITFDDGRRLRVRQASAGKSRQSRSRRSLEFSLYKGKKRTHRWQMKPVSEPHGVSPHVIRSRRGFRGHPFHAIEEFLPMLKRIGPSMWVDARTGEHLSFNEVIIGYGEMLPFDISGFLPESKKWLRDLLGSLTIHVIHTQRLSAETPKSKDESSGVRDRPTAAVQQYSEDMASRIKETQQESGVLSASLDRTFPHRLLQARKAQTVNDQRIRTKYKTQTEYRKRLMEAGLIEPEKVARLSTKKLRQTDIEVLSHYLDDVGKKLSVFDGLLKKVELFKDIINTRFLYKSFSIDKSKGFLFTDAKGVRLPSKALSSGEQHEVVLAYQLIFMVSPKSLILIDEPELSLHVTWQHKFLDDLARISELGDLDFLIATHSPSIVHKRRDLMVPLEGPDQ